MLIYKDEYEITQLKERVMFGHAIAVKLVDTFNALPLQKIKTLDQLKRLVQDPDSFISEMLPLQTDQKLFGVTINRAKAIQLIDMDTRPLLETLQASDKRLLSEFMDNASDKLEIDPKRLAESIKRWEVVAVTDKQKAVANALLSIEQGINSLVQMNIPKERLINFPTLGNLVMLSNGQVRMNIKLYHRLSI